MKFFSVFSPRGGRVIRRLPLVRRTGWSLWISIWVPLLCGGATCRPQTSALPFPPPPAVALSPTPTLAEVVAVVNRNAAVDQLSCPAATVRVTSMPSLPKLSATMFLRRDRDFRLRAKLPLMLAGGVDLGSNMNQFWLQVPEAGGDTLYFARHDDYRRQMQRTVLPVDPTWVMDALGLVTIDPSSVIAGPVRRADGRLEIRSRVPMPDGMYNRVAYIDSTGGFVTDQLLYDSGNRLVAASRASSHAYYPLAVAASTSAVSANTSTVAGNTSLADIDPSNDSGASSRRGAVLPHEVEVILNPPGGQSLALHISVGSYIVNQLTSVDPSLFVMPTGAARVVDLTQTGLPNAAVRPAAYTADRSVAAPLRGL